MGRFLAFAAWLALALGAVAPANALTPAVRAIITTPTLQPETRAAVAVMPVRPPTTNLRAGDRFIRTLKGNGDWYVLDALPGGHCLGSANAQDALVDLKLDKSATPVNSIAFTVNRGFAPDGATTYLNLSYYVPSTNAVNLTTTSATIGAYLNGTIPNNGASIGMANGSSDTTYVRPKTGGSESTVAAMSTAVSGTTTTSTGQGLTTVRRTGSTFYIDRNGVNAETVSPSTSAGALNSVAPFVGADNNAGSPQNFMSGVIFGGVIAGYMTPTQLAAFYAAELACATAVGAQ